MGGRWCLCARTWCRPPLGAMIFSTGHGTVHDHAKPLSLQTACQPCCVATSTASHQSAHAHASCPVLQEEAPAGAQQRGDIARQASTSLVGCVCRVLCTSRCLGRLLGAAAAGVVPSAAMPGAMSATAAGPPATMHRATLLPLGAPAAIVSPVIDATSGNATHALASVPVPVNASISGRTAAAAAPGGTGVPCLPGDSAALPAFGQVLPAMPAAASAGA